MLSPLHLFPVQPPAPVPGADALRAAGSQAEIVCLSVGISETGSASPAQPDSRANIRILFIINYLVHHGSTVYNKYEYRVEFLILSLKVGWG